MTLYAMYNCKNNIKVITILCRRCFCTKKKGNNKYSKTVILPKTKYPLWLKGEERIKRDRYLEEKCSFSELYSWQRENIHGPEFILHDGPPYSNGAVHMGHAINKILKDVTNRYKLMDGFKIHYVPGWDCHGLPIELKAISGENWMEMPAIDIRRKARNFAKSGIEEQKSVFMKWGILANWDQDYYTTFSKEYTKNQLLQFYNLYEKGFIFRGLKPIYWSPSSRTALAEAELEYNENHVSKSITFRVKVNESDHLSKYIEKGLYAVVWTTTPWTLPANQAVAYNENLSYSIVSISNFKGTYLVATDLLKSLENLIKTPVQTIDTFPGECLKGTKYTDILYKDSYHDFLPSHHVLSTKGTGFVHIAPAHGQDDFCLGIAHNIKMKCIIDDGGFYKEEAGEYLKGCNVMVDGNEKVIEMLSSDLICANDITHSYPYDWRTKEPTIMRASQQWFIDTNSIKNKAAECLENVRIVPEKSGKRLHSQLITRPYWCISRQRVWGVPIPALYDTNDNVIIDREFINHYCRLIDEYDSDFWWSLDKSFLIPENRMEKFQESQFEKGKDILDIWFDSGISWSSVLGMDKIADVYLEGIDQCNGWFQSSLMTSVALRNKAPYKNIFIHGFAVDENGRKMSKSVGNVVHPNDITNGSSVYEAYGIDILRYWVAGHSSVQSKIPITLCGLNDVKNTIQKYRLTFKFLLGALNNYKPNSEPQFWILDKYMLICLRKLYFQTRNYYENFEYDLVTRELIRFVVNEVSAQYLHLVKDRLYCDAENSPSRQACQYVICSILDTLLFVLSPITPHLVEETFLYHPKYEGKSYFQSVGKASYDKSENDETVERSVKIIYDLKSRISCGNTKDNQLVVDIMAPHDLYNDLKNISECELLEILQVSKLNIYKFKEEEYKIDIKNTNKFLCKRCRRYTCIYEYDELCDRCLHVVNEILINQVE